MPRLGRNIIQVHLRPLLPLQRAVHGRPQIPLLTTPDSRRSRGWRRRYSRGRCIRNLPPHPHRVADRLNHEGRRYYPRAHSGGLHRQQFHSQFHQWTGKWSTSPTNQANPALLGQGCRRSSFLMSGSVQQRVDHHPRYLVHSPSLCFTTYWVGFDFWCSVARKIETS